MIPRGIEVLWEQRDAMLAGFLTTFGIAVVAAVCAGLLGLVLFALLISRVRGIGLALALLLPGRPPKAAPELPEPVLAAGARD